MNPETTTTATKTPFVRDFDRMKDEARGILAGFGDNREPVVLVRLGDFFEAFGDDAWRLSSICSLALTRRAGVPMAGIPFHSLDRYAEKLTAAGCVVAVADSTGLPRILTICKLYGVNREPPPARYL